jgi:hypothetical protein
MAAGSAVWRFPLTIITKISEPGDVLGLNATVSNRPYEVTVEMIEPGQANFITRDALLHFLREHGEVALRVAEQLSRNYYTAYEEIRTLGLTSVALGEVREITAGMVQYSAQWRSSAGETDAYAWGNRRNDWHNSWNSQPLVFWIQKTAIGAVEGRNSDYPQQSRARKNGQLLTTRTFCSVIALSHIATSLCIFSLVKFRFYPCWFLDMTREMWTASHHAVSEGTASSFAMKQAALEKTSSPYWKTD